MGAQSVRQASLEIVHVVVAVVVHVRTRTEGSEKWKEVAGDGAEMTTRVMRREGAAAVNMLWHTAAPAPALRAACRPRSLSAEPRPAVAAESPIIIYICEIIPAAAGPPALD